MRRHELTDEQWNVVADLLQAASGRGRPSALGDRNFINAVVWIAKTGAPWRDLPERFGPWKTIFNRFSEWSKRGVWEGILRPLLLPTMTLGR